MFKNYIKTAFRSLTKNKAYSFLNIFGLAIGIVCAALIFLWVEDEVNYDSFNLKKDRLYEVRENQKYDTYIYTHSHTHTYSSLLMPSSVFADEALANVRFDFESFIKSEVGIDGDRKPPRKYPSISCSLLFMLFKNTPYLCFCYGFSLNMLRWRY